MHFFDWIVVIYRPMCEWIFPIKMNSFLKFFFRYLVTIRINLIWIRRNSSWQTEYRSYLGWIRWQRWSQRRSSVPWNNTAGAQKSWGCTRRWRSRWSPCSGCPAVRVVRLCFFVVRVAFSFAVFLAQLCLRLRPRHLYCSLRIVERVRKTNKTEKHFIGIVFLYSMRLFVCVRFSVCVFVCVRVCIKCVCVCVCVLNMCVSVWVVH